MEQILQILHSQHNSSQLVCACDSFIKEISKNDFRTKTYNKGLDSFEVGNCFMAIFLSNLNNNLILPSVVNAIIELVQRFPKLKNEYAQKGIYFNIVDLIKTHKLLNTPGKFDDDKNIRLICALKLATELTKNSTTNFVSAMDAGIFKLVTTGFLEADYDIKLACTELLVVLLSFDKNIEKDCEDSEDILNKHYKDLIKLCLFAEINSESLLSQMFSTMNQFIKEPVQIQLNCLIYILKFFKTDGSLANQTGAIDTLLHACSQHGNNIEVISLVFQILNIMVSNQRVDNVMLKLDYITDVAMQAILNYLENEEIVLIISKTLKVIIESDVEYSQVFFEKDLFKLIYFTLKQYYCKHTIYPANMTAFDVCECLSYCLVKMMESSDTRLRNEALYKACMKDNVDQVLLLIYLGVNFNFVGSSGKSPLVVACEKNYVFLVQQIVCLTIMLQYTGVLKSRVDNIVSGLQICPNDSKIISFLLWYLLHRDNNGVAEWSRAGLKQLNIEILKLALSKVDNGTLYSDLHETVAFQICSLILHNKTFNNTEKGYFEISQTFFGELTSKIKDQTVIKNNNNSILCSYCNGSKSSFKKFLRLSFSEDSENENACGCYIHFPPNIESVEIQEINLSHNQICDLLPFANLNNEVGKVKILNLTDNLITVFPDLVAKKFKNLAELNISKNSIPSFPFYILYVLKFLIKLDLSDNCISNYTEKEVLLLKKKQFGLKLLNLSDNKLSVFPAWIFNHLPHLNHLHLQNNEIMKLNPKSLLLSFGEKHEICSLLDLKLLNMKGNCLQFLKDFLNLMPNIEEVDFSENLLEVIEEEVESLKCRPLKVINLSSNLLDEVPKMIKHLSKLQTVNLSNNTIGHLKDVTDWSTSRLQCFDFSCNQICDIDNLCIALCTKWNLSIKKLNMSHNNIETLPSTVGKLENLNTLNVSFNKIGVLPDEIGNLTNLTQLEIKENKLNLDSTILNGSTTEIQRFLYARLKKSVPHNQVKLLFVGNPLAGKTTLLQTLKVTGFRTRTFSGNFLPKSLSFSETKPLLATVGVEVTDFILKQGSKTYNISAWDFAGQEDFYATHPCFLSERAMYIAVYDASKGPQEVYSLKPWLSAIQSRATHCPVLIVGTHIDLVAKGTKEDLFRLLEIELKKMSQLPWFPRGALKSNKISHELLDAKELSGFNTVHLKTVISTIISETKIHDIPLVGGMVPYSFIQLEKLLKEEAEIKKQFPVINFHELECLTRNKSNENALFETAADLMMAVKHLHQTGSLLHFDDPRSKLGDCFFIKPHWLCQLLAKVVTFQEDRSFKVSPYITEDGILSKKIFTQNFIDHQSKKDSVPVEFLPRLLRLLENFEILLWQGGDVYLVPSKLAITKPDLPEFKHVIVRYFSMVYLPLGFWPRLIARILSFADQLLRGYLANSHCFKKSPKTLKSWRSGMYLDWENLIEKQFVIVQTGSTEYDKQIRKNENYSTAGPIIDDDFEHLSYTKIDKKGEGLEVIVPSNQSGKILLGQLVDHINNLVEEWYPGLLDVDQFGKLMFMQYTPCPICVEYNQFKHINSFCINSLAESTMCSGSLASSPYKVKVDENGNLLTFCFNHLNKPVSVSSFAPEVSVDDFDFNLRLDHTLLNFYPSNQELLGDGGFGSVYHAFYDNEDVAIKTFHNVRSGSSYKMLRTELIVLASHHHPSIISVKGFIPFSIPGKPYIPAPLLALEYAKLGSLGQLLRDMTRMDIKARSLALSMELRHRIVFEIADGLEFLHSKYIAYRDLKPDNVLLMSLDPTSPVIIKLTDYGVSTLASPSGVHGSSGTPGYCAPEIVSLRFHGGSVFMGHGKLYAKNESSEFFRYSVQCDIYSFGLLIHEIAVGKSPWVDYLVTNTETKESCLTSMDPDEIILEGIKPGPLISYEGVEAWPACQLVIDFCLRINPEERPTSKQLLQFISNLNFSSLKLSSMFNENGIKDIAFCGEFQNLSTSILSANVFYTTPFKNECTDIFHSVCNVKKGYLINEEKYVTLSNDLTISCMKMLPFDVTNKITDEDLTKSKWGYPVIVLGTKQGKVVVCCDGMYNTKHSLSHPITCMTIHKPISDGACKSNCFVLVGLENATLALFTIEQILNTYDLYPLHKLDLSTFANKHPISSLTSCGNSNVFAASEKHIIILSVADSGTPYVCGTRVVGNNKTFKESKCYQIQASCKNIYAYCESSHNIFYWKMDGSSYISGNIDVFEEIQNYKDTSVSSSPKEILVTIIHVDKKHGLLWVGTNLGHVIIFLEPISINTNSKCRPMSVFHDFSGPVQSLSSVRIGSADYIIAVGQGNRKSLKCQSFKDNPQLAKIKKQSFIKIWDANFQPRGFRFSEVIKQRKTTKTN